jgi:hypothetical protein
MGRSSGANFLPECLQLFLPTLAAHLAPDDLTLLDPHGLLDPPHGPRRTADLAAQVHDRQTPAHPVLLHLEVQISRGGRFGSRMWEYHTALAHRYHCPVISIALLPFAAGGIRLVRYSERVLGRAYIKLEYWRIGLRGLQAEPSLREGSVLGTVLAGLMQHGGMSTVELRVLAAERIEASGLAGERKRVLIDFVQAYLPLSLAEYAAYLQRTTGGGETMKTIEKTWSEQLLEQGREQGLEQGREQGREEGRQQGRELGLAQGALQARREVLVEQVRARFGAVPDSLTARIAGADRTTLDRLLVRVVTVRQVEDLLDA